MLRYIKARPRLTVSVLVGIVVWFALPPQWRSSTRLLVSWDVATILYLILAGWMMFRSDTSKIRARAATQDEGSIAILLFTIFSAVASLAGIIAELANAKELTGFIKGEHIAVAGVTVFLSWSFMQTMFALHYAHEYYGEENGRVNEGLEFPGQNHRPDYWDFIYYSFVVGTAAQTADVNIISGIMRKVTTVHCVVVFFFNTTILALTVNISAGLF